MNLAGNTLTAIDQKKKKKGKSGGEKVEKGVGGKVVTGGFANRKSKRLGYGNEGKEITRTGGEIQKTRWSKGIGTLRCGAK